MSKMYFKKALVVAISAITLGGCSMMNVIEYGEQQREITHEIDKAANASGFDKVLTLQRPPLRVGDVVQEDKPAWLSEKISLIVDQLPLNLVLRDLVGKEIGLEYGYGVNPNLPVSVYFEGTIEEALNILSVTADYGFMPKDDRLEVAMQETKTFFIPAVSGSVSYQLGSAGGSSASSGVLEGVISSTGGGDGQYSRIKADGYSASEHIKKGIESILRGVDESGQQITLGYVQEVPLMSSLVVKASPRIMRDVERYVEESVAELGREVDLEVKVVEFLADDRTQIGADLNGVLSAEGNQFGLNLVSPSLGDVVDTGLQVALGSSVAGGRLDGSTGVVSYLERMGQVTVKTFQRVKASNYQMQEIDLSEVQSYISKIESNEVDGSNSPTVSIEKAIVRDGVKMLVLPTIKDDSVYLRLTGTLSKLLGFETTEVASIKVKDARVRQARFNTSGRYEFNKDIVVTHMRQEVTQTDESKYAEVKTGVSGQRQVVDTIVIVTPRRHVETR
ncbi:hypothetical protein F7U66_00905 [Vibrio parahaemolyticus]|nr:hypothetical protein [Vibrio parahaemolyticus]